MKNITTSLLTAAALAFAADAYAAANIEIVNHTDQRACFAETGSFYVAGEGSGKIVEGWTCVDPEGSYKFDIGPIEYIYVSAIDSAGNDFLENRLSTYPQTTTYAPIDTAVNEYGLETVVREDGTFSFAYYMNEDDWGGDTLVSDRNTFESLLTEKGFRKITARTFRGADGGRVVHINF